MNPHATDGGSTNEPPFDEYQIPDDQPIEYLNGVTDQSPDPNSSLDSRLVADETNPRSKKDLQPPGDKREVRRAPNGAPPSPHADNSHITKDSPVAGYFNLYRWHPFTELFCLIAEWFESKGRSDVEQRSNFAKEHQFAFKIAIFLDYFLLFLVVSGILAAISFIAIRAVGVQIEVVTIPFPWFG